MLYNYHIIVFREADLHNLIIIELLTFIVFTQGCEVCCKEPKKCDPPGEYRF